jgi:putative FmdB family regulatory protein
MRVHRPSAAPGVLFRLSVRSPSVIEGIDDHCDVPLPESRVPTQHQPDSGGPNDGPELSAMPIFEYQCRMCGCRFERLVLRGSETRCPSCASQDLHRLMSVPTVRSDQTKRRASKDVRTLNRAVRQDLAHEEVKRLESHPHDHDD